MFVESLVESSPLLRNRSRLPALLSVAAQASLIAVVIAIPLLHPEVLAPGQARLAALLPPLPPPAPPPPPRPRVVTTASPATSAPTAPAPQAERINAVAHPSGPTLESPLLGVSISTGPNAPGAPIGPAPSAPNVVEGPAAAGRGRARVSEGVIAGLLIAPIQAVYPPMARITRTEGTVIVQAIIARDGRIESAHAVSGPPLLQAAALDAVRAARYHPYLLNHEPTEVETTIRIIFRMSQ